MLAILRQVVADRRASPGEDLTSALLAAGPGEDGTRLSETELAGTLQSLLIAGHETIVNLICNAVRALCRHRDQLDLVRSGRVSWEDVVEETLRYDGPVGYFPFRYPTADLTVGATVIPRGAPVLVSYTSAGRDADAHGPDADRFDLNRPPGRHLSFGHGPHACLGAALARMEGAIALEALFRHFPELELAVPAEEVPPHPSFVGNGVEALPVRLGRDAGLTQRLPNG
ncbi:hypothetical protein CD790_22505 [Streptomyces sp. SAJ15]|nr:cytochrome P450 [Streptomyces sp. SAJ15]TVL90283.1 hypothetical protein CD790_22505 [Streptomyces sp. SAJ15]